jgi:hypothetical protein
MIMHDEHALNFNFKPGDVIDVSHAEISEFKVPQDYVVEEKPQGNVFKKLRDCVFKKPQDSVSSEPQDSVSNEPRYLYRLLDTSATHVSYADIEKQPGKRLRRWWEEHCNIKVDWESISIEHYRFKLMGRNTFDNEDYDTEGGFPKIGRLTEICCDFDG